LRLDTIVLLPMIPNLPLPTQFTTATPLSKFIAMVLFIALPFIGFWFGMNYQTQISQQSSLSPIPVDPIVTVPAIKSTTPPAETTITSFVENADFPAPQGVRMLFSDPLHGVKVFTLSYGAAQDCLSGCFYSNATGIEYGAKIGWISMNNYDAIDDAKFVFYDFDISDTYLYTDEFFQLLNSKDTWVYQNAFLVMLAEDEDVPRSVLLTIAQGLSSYIQPSLANSLLKNVTVRNDREIVTALANLPVFSGDAYSEIRTQAQELLNGL